MAYATEQMRSYMAGRRARIRADLITMLGGACVKCGSGDDLDFDHVDPATKLFAIASGLDRPRDEILAEAAKCQLLCRPHHIEKTKAENRGRHFAGSAQARGERIGKARLNDQAAAVILLWPASQRALATAYGISPGTVSAIRAGRTWRHVRARIEQSGVLSGL